MPTLKLPALKPSHMDSLASPANEALPIWISDDDSDTSSEPGTEDDSGGDVSVNVDDVHGNSGNGSDIIHHDARGYDADRDEGRDDWARHERDADDNSHAHENSFDSASDDTGDNNSTARGVSSRRKRDRYDAVPATPGADVSSQDTYDGPYNDLEDRDTSNYGMAVDERQVLDQREDIETYVDAIKNGNIANSYKDAIAALTHIRSWLDQLEAKLNLQGKRKQNLFSTSACKEAKKFSPS